MIDYNSWKRIKLKPTSLKLDDENLRLSGFSKKPSERDIIHYMVEHEKILQLSKSISEKDSFPMKSQLSIKMATAM
jgi:hypothetical protein